VSPTFPVLQSNGQTLEPATVMNPRAGAPGDSYHMTVPSRYLELGQIREALQVWRIDDGSKARIPEEISLTSRTGAGEHGASRWPRSRSLQSSLRGSRRRGQHHLSSAHDAMVGRHGRTSAMQTNNTSFEDLTIPAAFGASWTKMPSNREERTSYANHEQTGP